MKTLLLTASVVLASTQAFSQVCEIPASQINVAGVGLGQSFAQFQRQHPTATLDQWGQGDLRIQFKSDGGSNTDAALARQGVESAMHISLTSRTKTIESFALNFTDGKLATLDTPLASFHKRLLQQFTLPQKGWKKHGNSMVYRCDDYHINIKQDHGVGRQTLGATVMVIGKHSDMFNDKNIDD